MDVVIRFPSCYPLRAVVVKCTRKLGVSENRLRKWMLSMAAFVRNQVTWHPYFCLKHFIFLFFILNVFSLKPFQHNALIWTPNLSCYTILFATTLAWK